MAVVIQFSSSPYPGLRPFRYDESDIFFGRERQTDQLLARLAHNRFLAVIGPSGCGKSSLVKAGMLPALRAGFMAEVGSRWRICELRPGDRPLEGLARALASPDILGADRDSEEAAAFLEATLRRGPLGLIEIVKGAEALRGATLLVLVDQFEEIFRYRERIAADEADAFVALLLASAGQHEMPIYVVITMRSDYLGECAVFQELPEAVSNSQYLTPRLTREELELAIAGPARAFGGQVDPRLQNRLINDFGTDPDQLPLLQHAMARLWSQRSTSVATPLLMVKDYEAIGALAAALSNHGDEVLAELTPEQQRIAEIMFRRLSGSENGRRDVRAPAQVEEVAKIAAAEVDEVIAVAEAFRRPDCCFLAAPEGPLRADTLLDVSHESLIRQWQRLAGWVAAEADSTEMYRRLCDWALRWEQHNADLWRGPDLASALAWRQKEKPSPEWAKRYGGRNRFQRAMQFLDASEEAQRAAAAAEEAGRQTQLRRVRRLAWGFGAATVSLAAVILFYFVAYRWDFNAYYTDHVKVWGVPQGIGPLSAAEVGHHVASYKITRRGRLGPVVSMQLVNAAGQPRNLQGTLEALSSDEMEKKVSRWEYVYDTQDQIAYEVFLDRHGQRLQSIIYSPPEQEAVRSRNAYEIRKGGSLAPQKGSCAAFLTYDYSPKGYEWRVHYLDQTGNPTPGKDNAFIKQSKYDRQGRVIESTSLWKDGRPMNDQDGNAGQRVSYDESGNMVAREMLDAAGKPIDVKKFGYQRFTCRYDDRGNCVEPVIWHADGSPVYHFKREQIFCHSRRVFYDDRGNIVGSACLMANGQPVLSARVKYDADDRPIEDTYFDRDGHPTMGRLGGFRLTGAYDAEGNLTEMAFFDEHGKAIPGNKGYHRKISKFESGREVRTEYRDGDGKFVAIKEGYAAVERTFDAQGNEVRTAYLGLDDRPVPNRDEGFAILLTTFDACGRETEKRFLDEHERPVRSKKGYAHLRQAYDESNNVNEETYLDESDQPVRSLDGYARVTREFDRHRNIIGERYFDERGKALLLKGAYAEHRSRYNDHNSLVEEAFLGASGEPVLNEKGWAKHIRRYDDKNALVEEAYFGASGEPVLNDEGWARMTRITDTHGRGIVRMYFGTDGKPVNWKQGYARSTGRYDDHGALVERAFFGTDGEPILIDEGFARVTNVRDEVGRIVEEAFFGTQGEPVVGTKDHRYHRSKLVLDERDNLLEFATFGTDGKPSSGKEGYAKVIRRYDARNAVVEEAYFGTGGEPVLHEDGYARVTYVRDNLGQVVETAFFGTDGQPIKQKHGYARLIGRYDDYGAFVEEVYFGVNGEPVLRDGRVARISVITDKLGRQIEWAYFGVRGEPAIGPEDYPFHRARRILDERDNVLEFATFGTDGKPLEVLDATSGSRCAKMVRHFDATNKEIDSECFDAAGNLTLESE
jgi:hypothetical protein